MTANLRNLLDYNQSDAPVVFALPSESAALRLRAVTLRYIDPRFSACDVEVLTAPQEQGPWTSLLRFESAPTDQGQIFGAVGDLPAIDKFVKVIMHSSYAPSYAWNYTCIANMALLCEEVGADE